MALQKNDSGGQPWSSESNENDHQGMWWLPVRSLILQISIWSGSYELLIPKVKSKHGVLLLESRNTFI